MLFRSLAAGAVLKGFSAGFARQRPCPLAQNWVTTGCRRTRWTGPVGRSSDQTQRGDKQALDCRRGGQGLLHAPDGGGGGSNAVGCEGCVHPPIIRTVTPAPVKPQPQPEQPEGLINQAIQDKIGL